jgi:two-component system NtrC family sensor kinase
VEVTVGILFLGTLAIGIMAFVLSKRIIGRIAEVDKEKDLMNEQIIETGKLASVGELAAGIAHEINNPVAIMVEEAGWIEDLLAEEDFKEGENLQEFQRALTQIRVQGRRCKDITHKLLSFARKTDSRTLEVHLNDLVTEVISLSEQRAKYANVTIRSHLRPSLPVLQASPSEIQQVLLNLINNALDAMEKDGGAIDVTTRLDGKNVVMEVSDTGKGIPEANLSRLFDPFFTTKPVGKGTGLGLSICYGIIKKLGGDIEVESTVDEGTTFRVTVPYA